MPHTYSEQGYWKKISRFAMKIGREIIEKALILYYAAQHPATPLWAKTIIYAALAYFISPVDAVPDAVPAVGFTDDLTILAAAFLTVSLYITPEAIARAKAKMRDIFGVPAGGPQGAPALYPSI